MMTVTRKRDETRGGSSQTLEKKVEPNLGKNEKPAAAILELLCLATSWEVE